MSEFLELEAGNLTIALFFLLIATIVATRPFVRSQVKKFIFFTVIVVFSILITGHYVITTNRMSDVKKAFSEGKAIECESRLNRKAAQSVVVRKNLGWILKGDEFSNPNYERVFHTARCIVKVKPKLKLK